MCVRDYVCERMRACMSACVCVGECVCVSIVCTSGHVRVCVHVSARSRPRVFPRACVQTCARAHASGRTSQEGVKQKQFYLSFFHVHLDQS